MRKITIFLRVSLLIYMIIDSAVQLRWFTYRHVMCMLSVRNGAITGPRCLPPFWDFCWVVVDGGRNEIPQIDL